MQTDCNACWKQSEGRTNAFVSLVRAGPYSCLVTCELFAHITIVYKGDAVPQSPCVSTWLWAWYALQSTPVCKVLHKCIHFAILVNTLQLTVSTEAYCTSSTKTVAYDPNYRSSFTNSFSFNLLVFLTKMWTHGYLQSTKTKTQTQLQNTIEFLWTHMHVVCGDIETMLFRLTLCQLHFIHLIFYA